MKSSQPLAGRPIVAATCRFGHLRFDEISYPKYLWLPRHEHSVAFLELCLEGTTQEFWGKQTFVRGSSTLNFFPIGTPHATCFQKSTRTFQITMNADWLERIRQYAPLLDTLTNYQNSPPAWIAARLYREFQRRDDLTPLILEGLLMEMFAEISRQTTDHAELDCPRWLRQAKEFLHAHFTESVSVEALAVTIGVHPSHLMRSFRRQHHCTIGDYIRRLRIEQACHLLFTSEQLPSQIAFAVGFADQSHFNRTFKHCMGVTPTEYKKFAGVQVSVKK
jgi:AraC family transcriptional regulator